TLSLHDALPIFGLAAGRTTVGKTGLTRLQLKLLRADGADFDRKCHRAHYDNNPRTKNLAIHTSRPRVPPAVLYTHLPIVRLTPQCHFPMRPTMHAGL